MNSLTRILVILVLVVIVGGTAALAMWDIPAPSSKIEKVIPDDHFQH
jgi:cell division septal protein FtsQ